MLKIPFPSLCYWRRFHFVLRLLARDIANPSYDANASLTQALNPRLISLSNAEAPVDQAFNQNPIPQEYAPSFSGNLEVFNTLKCVINPLIIQTCSGPLKK